MSLSNAALIIEMWAVFEVWLISLVAGSGSRAVRLVVSDGLPVHQLSATAVSSDVDDRSDPVGQFGHEQDPHIWQDPVLVMECIHRIELGLCELLPERSDSFRQRS